MRSANCLTCGSLARCDASWPSSTSAMPPSAAFMMKLRSDDERLEAPDEFDMLPVLPGAFVPAALGALEPLAGAGVAGPRVVEGVPEGVDGDVDCAPVCMAIASAIDPASHDSECRVFMMWYSVNFVATRCRDARTSSSRFHTMAKFAACGRCDVALRQLLPVISFSRGWSFRAAPSTTR